MLSKGLQLLCDLLTLVVFEFANTIWCRLHNVRGQTRSNSAHLISAQIQLRSAQMQLGTPKSANRLLNAGFKVADVIRSRRPQYPKGKQTEGGFRTWTRNDDNVLACQHGSMTRRHQRQYHVTNTACLSNIRRERHNNNHNMIQDTNT